MLLWTWNQRHRLHIAHVQMQFHPRWNLTAANTPNTNESKLEPIHLACDYDRIARQSWEHSKTAWRIFISGGGFLLALKAKLPELLPKIYSLDLEVIARHLLTMSSHWKTAMWHWSQQIHHRMKWVVWGYATNGCTAEIPTTCQAQSGSQTGIKRSPMQPQMFIILGIWYVVLGFTSKAAQPLGGPKFDPYPLDPMVLGGASLFIQNRMHSKVSKGTFGPKVDICWNHHSEPAKMRGKAGDWRCVA